MQRKTSGKNCIQNVFCFFYKHCTHTLCPSTALLAISRIGNLSNNVSESWCGHSCRGNLQNWQLFKKHKSMIMTGDNLQNCQSLPTYPELAIPINSAQNHENQKTCTLLYRHFLFSSGARAPKLPKQDGSCNWPNLASKSSPSTRVGIVVRLMAPTLLLSLAVCLSFPLQLEADVLRQVHALAASAPKPTSQLF